MSFKRWLDSFRDELRDFKFPFTLYKMLFKNFIYWFLIFQGLCIVIFLIFDLVPKIDSYMEAKVKIMQILLITLLFVPKALWLTMPVSIMFGVIMALGSLYQHNELVAIYTCGISLTQFTIPVYVFSLLLSVAMIFGDSYVVIPGFRYRERLYNRLTREKEEDRSLDNEEITIRGKKENLFWHAGNFISAQNKLERVIIFEVNSDFSFVYRLNALSAVYTKSGWLFKSGIIRQWGPDGKLFREEKFNKRVIDFEEDPSLFRSNEYEIEDMTIGEARERIKVLRELNLEHNKDLTNYYKKFSFPFTLLLVSIFAIGVSTISRTNILIIAMFFSIGLAVLYYIVQMILEVLAHTGQIPPLIGAWITLVIFLPASVVILRRSKT